MVFLGVLISIGSFLWFYKIWKNNEWRYPIFELEHQILLETGPRSDPFILEYKKRTLIIGVISIVAFSIGLSLIYLGSTGFWPILIGSIFWLLLLRGVIGLVRSAYSPKIRLLNYLYSPYLHAWKRDHWSNVSDEVIAKAICSAVDIDSNSFVLENISLDNFLTALCSRTRPKVDDYYPDTLQELKEQANKMVWSG